jgi:hypothetical protein
MREDKVRWSTKQVTAKSKAKNTHATVSDDGDIVDPVEDASTKVTTVTETDEVDVVCDPVLTKKSPVIINIKKRKANEGETLESSVTEPVMKRRKVKLAERVVSSQKVTENLKHKGKGKRSKPARTCCYYKSTSCNYCNFTSS